MSRREVVGDTLDGIAIVLLLLVVVVAAAFAFMGSVVPSWLR